MFVYVFAVFLPTRLGSPPFANVAVKTVKIAGFEPEFVAGNVGSTPAEIGQKVGISKTASKRLELHPHFGEKFYCRSIQLQ